MGAACTSGLTAFSARSGSYPVKVLIIGRQGTGKTFLLYSWRYGVESILSVEPTKHFNVDTIMSPSGKKFLVYDLAGNIGLRLRPFLDGTNGVIYMLGIVDNDILGENEIKTIQQLLQQRDLENASFLFVIRKAAEEPNHDLPEKLQASLEGRVWELVTMRPNSQEDADLVFRVLEKLFLKSNTIER